MKGLRTLFAFLGCLAVIAAGLPPLAWAWTPSKPPAAHQTTVSALCTQHCPECQGAPCPPSAAGCMVACVGLAPALGVATFTFWMPPGTSDPWLAPAVILDGLSRPPDPLPPRA